MSLLSFKLVNVLCSRIVVLINLLCELVKNLCSVIGCHPEILFLLMWFSLVRFPFFFNNFVSLLRISCFKNISYYCIAFFLERKGEFSCLLGYSLMTGTATNG